MWTVERGCARAARPWIARATAAPVAMPPMAKSAIEPSRLRNSDAEGRGVRCGTPFVRFCSSVRVSPLVSVSKMPRTDGPPTYPPEGSVRGERAHFTRLVLGCIEAKFAKKNMPWKALAEIYKMHSFAPFLWYPSGWRNIRFSKLNFVWKSLKSLPIFCQILLT